MAIAAISSKAPVDLSVLSGFVTSPKVTPQTRGKAYFYGQATNGEESNTVGAGIPILKWVASAQPKLLTLDAVGVTVEWPDDEDGNDLFETFRITHPETITDPDDPDTSVDVDVIDVLGLKKKSSDSVLTYDFTSGGGT